jgi:lipopolysaccharide/colanic/teichoic acid biosynthesis glycosyltransferase
MSLSNTLVCFIQIPGNTGPASMKYANEEELLAQQPDPVKYNDEVIWPDKVRINLAYLQNRTLWLDIKIIIHTVLGKKLENW